MNPKLYNILICLLFLIFVVSSPINAQNRKARLKKASALKILEGKPSIYISFERLGKRTPLRDTETDEGVWLRLNNNMGYSIRFCSFGISDEGEQLIASDKNSQIGINYDIEVTNSRLFDKTRYDIPSGYRTGSLCFGYELKAGKSIVFAVPKEHLAKGLSIKIPFNYEWEDETENNPIHFVYFNSLSLSQ